MADARAKLGFKTIVVHEDLLYFNAAQVECALQKRFDNWDLGRRCWRVAGAGGFGLYKKWDAIPGMTGTKTIKVFIAYSHEVPDLLAKGVVKVNDKLTKSKP